LNIDKYSQLQINKLFFLLKNNLLCHKQKKKNNKKKICATKRINQTIYNSRQRKKIEIENIIHQSIINPEKTSKKSSLSLLTPNIKSILK